MYFHQRSDTLTPACDFCKKWGQFCIPSHKRCLNTNGLRRIRTGTTPLPGVTIVGRVGPRASNYIILENVHPIWKNRRKKFVRNSARQKRKERVYYR